MAKKGFHFAQKYAWCKYVSAVIISSGKRTVFPAGEARESFEEQIMSKEEYPCIMSCQKEAIVFIIRRKKISAARAVSKIALAGAYSVTWRRVWINNARAKIFDEF